MEMDDSEHVVPFQLQFDKPIASQVKIAEWNPEKDLLAMVTEDSKITLHRFNWQRLWTISPGKSITSLCWRPDGKAIAVGLEDGTISLHDVETEAKWEIVEKLEVSWLSVLTGKRRESWLEPFSCQFYLLARDCGISDDFTLLLSGHALDSSPQEEFLSLLGGGRTSPAVHQFLVNTLGEVAGFTPCTSLDETLVAYATEKSGMMLVQVEQFMRVLTSVEQQLSNFFNWLLKCIKLLMQEPSDQLLPYNSELVVIFMKFLYNQDPVRKLLDPSEVDQPVEADLETMQSVQDLVQFGEFWDTEYLRRTLAKEFQQMESRMILKQMTTTLWIIYAFKSPVAQVVFLLNGATDTPETSGDASTRGVACVFAARKRALVYILEEDEEDVLEIES
ncbi:unnamed protein product [Linum tenue]|uniref:Anaphase-promoting complex subunit 4 n=1 Tax=Linum tenue TaxID=586396 RepID=A0AAV0PB09_9ROSI|nr:unnamed protein product [Linum tenue]